MTATEVFTTRRYLILDAFRARGGHLTPAELAVPDVGGSRWRAELHAMRTLGYVLIEEANGDWHLEGDPKITEPETPEAFDFDAALRSMTERGRQMNDELRGVSRARVGGRSS